MAIRAPSPFEGVNQILAQILAMQQQGDERDMQRAQLGLQQQQLAAQQAATGAANLGAAAQVQGALAGPEAAAAGQVPQVQSFLQGLGNAQVGSGQAMALAQPAATAAGTAVQAAAKDRKQKQYLAKVQELMTPEDFERFNVVSNLIENGMDPQIARSMMPETALQRVERLRAETELASLNDARAADQAATAILVRQGFLPADSPEIVPGASGSLTRIVQEDRVAARQERQAAAQNAVSEASGIALELVVQGVEGPALRNELKRRFPNVSDGERAKLAFEAEKNVRASRGAPGELRGRADLLLGTAEAANRVIGNLEQEGVTTPTGTASLLRKVPIVGQFAIGSEQQRMLNAGEVLAQAILRLETGAQANEQEIRSAAMRFIPQPGDTPELLQQKATLRTIAIEQIRQAAGRRAAGLPTGTYSPENPYR